MATFRIPNDGQIRQLNTGDVYGELWASKNIDLASSPGKIRLARPTEQVMTAGELGNDTVEAIEYFDDKLYVCTDDTIYSDNSPYNNFSSATTGIASAQDMVVFDGQLRITENTDIARYNGSASFSNTWWTSDISGTALTSGVPHIMHVLRASGRDTLAVTDGNTLRYYNTAATHTSFSWDAGLIGCCQTSSLNFGWVGTYNETGANAEVIQWQVGNDQYTQSYPINGRAVLAMTTVNNLPVLINERGEIQRFNQAGFSTIATLPLWNTPEFLDGVETGLIQSSNTARPVHPKGMQVFGDKLLIYVNGDAISGAGNVNERTPSGVWEVDLNTGSVSHRGSANGEFYTVLSSPVFVMNDENSRYYFGGRRDGIVGGEEGLFRENLAADAQNYGYFVTTELHGDSFIENYESVFLSAVQDTDDSIVVKYRASGTFSLPVYGSGNWLDTTSFTTGDDLSGLSIGDEVEITVNSNSGRTAHVTAIQTGSSTTQITVDEAIGTEGEAFEFQADNWKKIDDPFDTTDLIKEIKLNQPGTMYQFKVCLTGKNGYPLINRMVVKTNNKKPL